MTLRPDTQSYTYQMLMKQRFINALTKEINQWARTQVSAFSVLKPEEILVKVSSYFLGRVSIGKILFVGEGNLSFALAVSNMQQISAKDITAATYEDERNISDITRRNAARLLEKGATVLHGVDATNLEKFFRYRHFDTIVFQFPNVGSRIPFEGRNPNFILIRDFLRSARKCLNPHGKVMITAVDSPHYQGAFHFEEAAGIAGFNKPDVYSFDPAKLPAYIHTNTNDENSALDGHNKFSTWVFSLQDSL